MVAPNVPIATQQVRNWITRAEAAEYLRVSVRHLDALLARRALTHYRLGSRVVFRVTDLDAYMTGNRVPAGGAA